MAREPVGLTPPTLASSAASAPCMAEIAGPRGGAGTGGACAGPTGPDDLARDPSSCIASTSQIAPLQPKPQVAEAISRS